MRQDPSAPATRRRPLSQFAEGSVTGSALLVSWLPGWCRRLLLEVTEQPLETPVSVWAETLEFRSGVTDVGQLI